MVIQNYQVVGWQWLDTAIFRRHIPKKANRDEWRPIYVRIVHEVLG